MKTNQILKIDGTALDKMQLEKHLQKMASSHNLTSKSSKNTYPIPHMIESFKVICEVYNLLNEHLKLGIAIHPAGEWLLDNLYIIEETVKQVEKELTLKKYTNFLGIANGKYKGFARIYVLASEIVAYTDNKIERKDLEDYLASYQINKSLSMEEIWNIGLFLEIAIIENIREICEKIYISQMQKYRAENIVERLVENKPKTERKFIKKEAKKIEKTVLEDIEYSFIEYMSYILKRYGKKANSYLNALEETVELAGTTISEVIQKEHFDIAVRKVSIGNSITSIKKIQRINFLEIFEKVNGVEELLKQDPSGVYNKMDYKTKEYYRNKIKEISKRTKVSELYITKKILELANQNESGQDVAIQDEKQNEVNKNGIPKKESHIGYYLIDNGIYDLYKALNIKQKKQIKEENKAKLYVALVAILSILTSLGISVIWNKHFGNIGTSIVSFFLFLIPISEIVIQTTQFILSKMVKPKLIPKLDLINRYRRRT